MSTQYFTSYSSVTDYLDKLGLFHMNPGLDNIKTILHNMGLVRLPFFFVQIVGTNGKGSTSSLLASLGNAHGLKTGLFTSPHFVSPRERIRIDGEMIDEKSWVQAANAVLSAGGDILTYFELLTAMAAYYFTEQNIEMGIFEAGLGGTWDTTSAFENDLLVYSAIGLDHQNVLGDTLAEIARDKAGAIRNNAPVLSARQEATVEKILAEIADAHNAPFKSLHTLATPHNFSQILPEMRLKGNFQKNNALLALMAWRECQYHLPLDNNHPDEFEANLKQMRQGTAAPLTKIEREGLTKAWIPGRMQFIASHHLSSPSLSPDIAGGETSVTSPLVEVPNIYLDGAHNPQGMNALGISLAKAHIAPAAVIFACLNDKQPEVLAANLRTLATGPIFVPCIPDNARAIPPQELAQVIGLQAIPVSSFSEAMSMAVDHIKDRHGDLKNAPPLLICGSLYLLAEFYGMFPQALQPSNE